MEKMKKKMRIWIGGFSFTFPCLSIYMILKESLTDKRHLLLSKNGMFITVIKFSVTFRILTAITLSVRFNPVAVLTMEDIWREIYRDRNPIITTTILSFTIHEIVYYSRYLPFFICDFIPSLEKYKIQQVIISLYSE